MPKYLTRSLKLAAGNSIAIVMMSGLPVAAESDLPLSNNGYQNNGYLSIGAGIGLGGNTTALGTGGIAILTKVKFSDNFSLHDATILFGSGSPTSMIIVSADFPIRNGAGQTIFSPFIGGGAMLRYSQGVSISPAISGGIDIPVSSNLTGTVRVNAGFPDRRPADVGILAGVGYNFGS
jgi:hypothetical protein